MADARVPCCVPFCRRTCAREKLTCDQERDRDVEWICAIHWRAIPTARRRAYSRLHRVWYSDRGRGMQIGAIWRHPKWGKRAVHRVAVERLWRRLKQMAIGKALAHG